MRRAVVSSSSSKAPWARRPSLLVAACIVCGAAGSASLRADDARPESGGIPALPLALAEAGVLPPPVKEPLGGGSGAPAALSDEFEADRAEEPSPAAAEETAAPAASQERVSEDFGGRGLTRFRDVFPLALFHLQLPVDNLEVLKAGELNFNLHFDWGNSHAVDQQSFIIDAETQVVELEAWYGVLDSVYVGAALPYIFRNGGALDPFVEGFHKVFGIENDERRERRMNDYEIHIDESGGRSREVEPGSGLGLAVLKAHWNAFEGSRWLPALAVEGHVGLPTANIGFGSSGLDYGLSVSLHKNVSENWYIHAVAGGVYFMDRTSEGLRFESTGYIFTLGAEYTVLDKLSLVVQGATLSPLLKSPETLDDPRNYIGGGVKWGFANDWEIEFRVQENLVPQRNSSDIVIGVSFNTSFGNRRHR